MARRLAPVLLGVAVGIGLLVAGLADVDDDGPGDAVRRLLRANVEQDLPAALDSLTRGEREALSEPMAAVVQQLRRIGAADRLVPLDDVRAGYERLERRRPTTERLADGVVAVVYAGDPPDVFVAVEEEGRWRVSLVHTALEYARRDGDLPRRPLDLSFRSRGADSPTQAVGELLLADRRGDLRRVLELLPPEEGRAFRANVAGLVAAHRQGEAAAEYLRELLLRPLGQFPDTEDAEGTRALTFSRRGDVVLVEPPGPASAEDTAFDAVFIYDATAALLPFPLEVLYLGDDLELDLGDPPFGYVTVERGGRWFVSLLGSRWHNAAVALRAFDDADARGLHRCLATDPDPFFGGC